MSLLNYIEKLLPRIDKKTVLEDIRISKTELDQIVIPTYEEAARFSNTFSFKSKEVSDIFQEMKNNYRSKLLHREKNEISELKSALNVVRLNLGTIGDEIEKVLEETSITDTITAKKAVLVRAAENISFISRFSTDLLNLMYIYEHISRGVESVEVSVYMTKYVLPNTKNFFRLLETYSRDPDNFKRSIESIPEVIINRKGYDAIMSLHDRESVDPFNSAGTVNFEMNPIYHFRLMIAEWQANRYKSYKEKKKSLELKLLNLKLLDDGKRDIKLEKEIEYIENRISSLEYNIAKMDESVR